MKKLKADYSFSDIIIYHEEILKVIRKEKAFYNYLEKTIPDELKDVFNYSFSSFGTSYIRCFLYFKKEMTISQMQEFFTFGKNMKKNKWSFEKFFREEEGKFTYKMEKKYKESRYLIFFEDAPNIDGCEIKKKTVEKEVYYSDCSELTKVF